MNFKSFYCIFINNKNKSIKFMNETIIWEKSVYELDEVEIEKI